ncbi:MAG: hypothetical protein AAF846_24070 [Chloroflexota bacterium]
MKHKFILLCILLLCTSVGLVSATEGVDDLNNPNDPALNERANACFEGGSMDGKCDELWDWQCGWFLIRLEQNIINGDQFPEWCDSLLSSEEAPQPEEFPGCQIINRQDIGTRIVTFYYDFGTSPTITIPFNVYEDPTCTTVFTVASGSFAVITYASTRDQAREACEPFFSGAFTVDSGAPLNSFVRTCFS